MIKKSLSYFFLSFAISIASTFLFVQPVFARPKVFKLVRAFIQHPLLVIGSIILAVAIYATVSFIKERS